MVSPKYVPLSVYGSLIMLDILAYRVLLRRDNEILLESQTGTVPLTVLRGVHYRHNFMTIWTFLLQLIFLGVAILDELSKVLGLSSGLQKQLGRARALIFNALLFPCTLLVIVIFWTLWQIDRELIFPKAVDQFFPSWLNHVLHTFIGIPLLLEVLLPKKEHFIKFKTAAPILLVFCLVYQAMYFSIYFRDGVWLYPVYKVLDWPQRLLFNVVQVTLILGFQYIGLKIQNSKKPKTQTTQTKKVK